MNKADLYVECCKARLLLARAKAGIAELELRRAEGVTISLETCADFEAARKAAAHALDCAEHNLWAFIKDETDRTRAAAE